MFYYKTRNLLCILFLSLSLFLFGCSSEEEGISTSAKPQSANSGDKSLEANSRITSSDSSANLKKPLPNKGSKPKQMVYHANISMAVMDLKEATKQIEKRAATDGAYLIESREEHLEKVITTNLTYRVPQAKFHAFLEATKKLAKDQANVQIQGDDVTEELVDLESRLKAKQAMEARLLELMKQSNQPNHLLEIAKQLDITQSEIEQIKGRLQYLQNRIDYSTVEISLSQPMRMQSSNQSLGVQMWDAFYTSISDLIILTRESVIWIAGAAPFLVILGAIFLGVRFFLQQKKKRQKEE